MKTGTGDPADDKRAIATEKRTPMRCRASARETVSVTGREGQASLSDARRSARLREHQGASGTEIIVTATIPRKRLPSGAR